MKFVFSLIAPAKIKVSPRLYEGLSFSRGAKIRLRIPITGMPFPRVTWVKDGEVIEPGGKVNVLLQKSMTCTGICVYDKSFCSEVNLGNFLHA